MHIKASEHHNQGRSQYDSDVHLIPFFCFLQELFNSKCTLLKTFFVMLLIVKRETIIVPLIRVYITYIILFDHQYLLECH